MDSIYWQCPRCGATAALPAKSITDSIRGLHQHEAQMHKLDDEREWRHWHRDDGGYVYVSDDGGQLGTVQKVNNHWYAAIYADIIGVRPDDGPFSTKLEAQKEVERLANRMFRVVLG